MTKGLVFAVVISTVAMGCGGGSGGSGLDTSVPASTPINKLSTSQEMQLCTDTGTYFTSTIAGEANSPTFTCRVLGIEAAIFSSGSTATDASLQKACQDAYAACLSLPADAGANDVDAGTFTDDCATTQQLGSCSATVGQYTACVDETVTAFQNLFPPCNQLTVAKASTLETDAGLDPTATGPACTALEAACPGITGDSSMTSSMLSATRSATRNAARAR